MSDKIFLDTNVVLDYYLDRVNRIEYAERLFSKIHLSKICISTATVLNSFYIAKPSSANIFEEFMMSFEPVSIDKATLNEAFKLKMDDFEDAVQLVSCLKAQCNIFLTWNTKEFPEKYKNIQIMTPENYLDSLVLS